MSESNFLLLFFDCVRREPSKYGVSRWDRPEIQWEGGSNYWNYVGNGVTDGVGPISKPKRHVLRRSRDKVKKLEESWLVRPTWTPTPLAPTLPPSPPQSSSSVDHISLTPVSVIHTIWARHWCSPGSQGTGGVKEEWTREWKSKIKRGVPTSVVSVVQTTLKLRS